MIPGWTPPSRGIVPMGARPQWSPSPPPPQLFVSDDPTHSLLSSLPFVSCPLDGTGHWRQQPFLALLGCLRGLVQDTAPCCYSKNNNSQPLHSTHSWQSPASRTPMSSCTPPGEYPLQAFAPSLPSPLSQTGSQELVRVTHRPPSRTQLLRLGLSSKLGLHSRPPMKHHLVTSECLHLSRAAFAIDMS